MTRNPLIGTWRLLSWQNEASDGSVTYPMGTDAIGFISYTGDGYVLVHIARADRANHVSDDPAGGSEQEFVRAVGDILECDSPHDHVPRFRAPTIAAERTATQLPGRARGPPPLHLRVVVSPPTTRMGESGRRSQSRALVSDPLPGGVSHKKTRTWMKRALARRSPGVTANSNNDFMWRSRTKRHGRPLCSPGGRRSGAPAPRVSSPRSPQQRAAWPPWKRGFFRAGMHAGRRLSDWGFRTGWGFQS